MTVKGRNDPAQGGVYIVTRAADADWPVQFYTAGYTTDGRLVEKRQHLNRDHMERACASWEARGAQRSDTMPGPPSAEQRAQAFVTWCFEQGMAPGDLPEGAFEQLARVIRAAERRE